MTKFILFFSLIFFVNAIIGAFEGNGGKDPILVIASYINIGFWGNVLISNIKKV